MTDLRKEIQEENAEEGPQTTESSLRYAAYFNRIRIVSSAHRYVAYTSDVGESFRPLVPTFAVRSAYGISWAYILGDVAYEGWKADLRSKGLYRPGLLPWQPLPKVRAYVDEHDMNSLDTNWKIVCLKRGIFQSVASMGLPAFTIHSTVKYTGRALRNAKNPILRSYFPVALGLAVVPALPYMFDEPVEHAVDWIFETGADFLEHRQPKAKQQ